MVYVLHVLTDLRYKQITVHIIKVIILIILCTVTALNRGPTGLVFIFIYICNRNDEKKNLKIYIFVFNCAKAPP